eukprot:Phypoly_transcript_07808.p1 GENE.Phypoly_transcript_07808~~Phypoly_transcript_07808.p1  ORF type:complete len:460 (+),score=62.87 Phypoly_transcript_07808:80-1459(+)
MQGGTVRGRINNYEVRGTPKKYVVLMGKVGVGKTTLFNKITNSNEPVDEGQDSITRKVTIANVAHGNVPMAVSDTPGLSSLSDTLHHALSIRNALNRQEVHAIVVVVKFERAGVMLRHISDVFESFGDYTSHLCVVVTHWDKIQKKGEDRVKKETKDIKDSFANAGITKVIYVGKNTQPKDLCTQLVAHCSPSPAVIKIAKSQIYKKFDLSPPNMLLDQKLKTAEAEFSVLAENMKNLMQSPPAEDRDSFFHSCMVSISTFAEEACYKFVKENGKTMTEMDSYAAYMKLKKKVAIIVKALRELAQEKMSFSLLDADDPRNRFRKCPFCGTIWIKVEGCDGSTTCGNIPEQKDVFTKPTGTFTFTYNVRGMLVYSYNKMANLQAVKSLFKKGVKGVGCGNDIVWRDLPILTESEFRLLKDSFTDIGISDILASNLKPSEEKSIAAIIDAEERRVEVDNRS